MAKLSNSALVAFFECPQIYDYEFRGGYQKPKVYLEFGHRMHQLLQNHYCPKQTLPDTTLDDPQEAEVQAMFEAYKATYPTEEFEVVDCEHRFELIIPPTVTSPLAPHTYLGKFDMLVRNKDGKLQLFETKTEARGSKRNLPKAWTARTQASLYQWAATEIYREPIDSIILNVCTKGSEKGRVGPTFRRDTLQRTPGQINTALATLVYVGDQMDRIGDGPFPRNTNNCISEFGWECDFYGQCHFDHPLDESAGLVQVEPYSYLSL